jgi:hypothetical protein
MAVLLLAPFTTLHPGTPRVTEPVRMHKFIETPDAVDDVVRLARVYHLIKAIR